MGDPGPLLAGIEAGGTKFVCALARTPAELLEEIRFSTAAPAETLAEAVRFFREAAKRHGSIAAMGIGTFGPARIDPAAADFGSILATPKAGWAGFDVIGAIRGGMVGEGSSGEFPIAFDTDVNAAAIGESEFGAGKEVRHLCYVTVGTGIGGGVLHDGRPLHGRLHPEIGHLVMPDLDAAEGKATNVCPFHESCLEGRASGPAIEARWGRPGAELPADHPAWDLEARYLARGAIDLTAAWSPDRILIGGGVMQQEGLIEKVRSEFEKLAGDYWPLPPPEEYLRMPALDQNAGIAGALTMARDLIG